MKNLSTVTARIVRESEQCKYKLKLKGKGEKYLVLHDEGENAGDIVMAYLSPFAKEPVKIQQTTLLKGRTEIIGKGETIFQAKIEFVTIDENKGKERKVSETYFVKSDGIREAFEELAEFVSGFISDAAITSVVRTKIVEVLGNDTEVKEHYGDAS